MRRMICVCIACLVISAFAFAEDGVVEDVNGNVKVKGPATAWEAAQPGMEVGMADTVSTGFRSNATVDLEPSSVYIKQLTRMVLEELVKSEGAVTTKVFLNVGSLSANVRAAEGLKQDFTVRSPIATTAVRGTQFEFDGITVKVSENMVTIINRVGQQRSVAAGEQSSAPGFFAPTSGEEGRKRWSIVVTNTARQLGEEPASTKITRAISPKAYAVPTTQAVICVVWP